MGRDPEPDIKISAPVAHRVYSVLSLSTCRLLVLASTQQQTSVDSVFSDGDVSQDQSSG